jgi:N-methylhydantoinase A
LEYVVGVDIGGTFTDCVVVDDEGRITLGKALSTPDDFALGAVHAVGDAATQLGMASERELLASTHLFFHACTVAENTLLTRSGPRTGLLTTAGFGETILMMRGKTAEGLTEAEAAHLSTLQKPEPIVPRNLIGEVPERVDYKGAVIMDLDDDAAARAIDELVTRGVQSFAIALLWSIKNDAHERRLARILEQKYPEIFYSLSNEVAPFLGEYERTVTTVFNAYIGPTISRYLANLQQTLRERGLRREPLIMQAYGGVLGIEATAKNAVGMIESGPAAGVVGSSFQGELVEQRNILAADMGGTTFKVGVIRNGEVERDYSPVIMRYNILSTKIWVESIGAGGGSIAWIDPEAGLLKVGPEGAGAKPGPVCYGLGGTEPTVSDADLILGYLNEDYFFGGRMRLDRDGATRALEEKIAAPLNVSLLQAASGIYRVTNAHMADLVRRATVERGHDPRAFVLYAYGGAGPVHAGRYAAELGIKQIMIPPTSAVQGGMGLISSDVAYEFGMSDHAQFPPDVERMNRNFASLIERGYRELRAAGFADEDVLVQRSLDMRYRFQTHELNVPLPPGTWEITEAYMGELDTLFDALYEQAYGEGSGYREAGKDIITFRLRVLGKLPKPQLKKLALGPSSPGSALKGRRPVFFEEHGDYVSTPVYQFEQIGPGMEMAGPAVIESPITTIVVNPHDLASMDEFRNIRIRIGGQESR